MLAIVLLSTHLTSSLYDENAMDVKFRAASLYYVHRPK